MLVADNLVKSFIRNEKKGKKTEFNAVDGISLTAKKGEIVGILGPNGAGKTTLLRMLASLLKPTSGEVYLSESGVAERESEESAGRNDDAVTDTLEIKKKVGYLSGNTKLYGRLSVRELLQVFAGVYGIEKSKIPERIEEIEKLLNMSEFIDNRIEKLSTGQTQRASIARCLVHDPDIYIFDEPTLGLDIISSSAIIEFMKKEKDRGKTVIYSTHYMEEAEYLCDRIIMLNKGKAITNDSPEELKKKTGASNMRDAFYAIIKAEGMDNED
ncbi:MAG: ATP-binding cassette domain-containing protein [Eubacterium sp.]|nr:ATP-binding cassette domain-containing protein [Eubacterium sp.]